MQRPTTRQGTDCGTQVEGDVAKNSESRGPEYRSNGDDQDSKGEPRSRSNSQDGDKSGRCSPGRGSPVAGEWKSRENREDGAIKRESTVTRLRGTMLDIDCLMD